MNNNFKQGAEMWLKWMTSIFSALLDRRPELTPAQKTRIEQMENDYEKMLRQTLSTARVAPKNK